MKPIKFKEQNCTFGEHQPNVIPLPAHKTTRGIVITCWKMPMKERLRVLFSGRVYLLINTHGRALQPLFAEVKSPFTKAKKEKLK